jgi:hypothetical protein
MPSETARSPSRLRENATKRRKGFLQGPFVPQDKLKPAESTQFTSALKHRPPKERDFFLSLLGSLSFCAAGMEDRAEHKPEG